MQDKTYILELNDMRSRKIETMTPAAWAKDPGAFDRLIAEAMPQRVTCKRGYHHNYPEGHPLHWFNRPYGPEWMRVHEIADSRSAAYARSHLPEAK